MKRLILAGGGHAHLVTLDRLKVGRPPDLDIVLVTPTPWQYYSGMLPGWIAGKYTSEQCRIDIRPVAARAGVTVISKAVVGVDAAANQINLSDGTTLDYNFLSLDIGAEARNPWADGLGEKLISAKPLDRFQADWLKILNEAKGGAKTSLTVVGGGAAGVELALVCKTALVSAGVKHDMSLVIGQTGLLHDHAPVVRERARSALLRAGIELFEGRAHADDGSLLLTSGQRLMPDWVIAATGAYAPAWLRTSGLQLDDDGFIGTDSFLRSVSHPNVFATGDISSRTDIKLPRSGVHAVKAGPVLVHNLLAATTQGEMLPYLPRKHSLYIMASGKGIGIASWGGWAGEGKWVWRWKDFIDRRFMGQFQNLAA